MPKCFHQPNGFPQLCIILHIYQACVNIYISLSLSLKCAHTAKHSEFTLSLMFIPSNKLTFDQTKIDQGDSGIGRVAVLLMMLVNSAVPV